MFATSNLGGGGSSWFSCMVDAGIMRTFRTRSGRCRFLLQLDPLTILSSSSASLTAGVRFLLPFLVMTTLSSILWWWWWCQLGQKRRRGATGQTGIDIPDTANVPVLVEHLRVNVLCVDGILEVGTDDEVAKVDLQTSETKKEGWTRREKGGQRTPGSTVMTLPAGRVPRTRR